MKLVYIVLMYIPPVTVACIYPYRNGKTDVCAYLLQVGANPSIANKEGKTPLDCATKAEIRKIFAEARQRKCK